MAKTLSFTDTSPQTVKIGDTTTSFTLICGNDNVATDLTNATSITVKLGNASGYLKSTTVDPASLTDPTTGQITVTFTADLMTSLPAGSYAIEVWVVDSNGTSIYPSDGSTGFTITNNIQSANGSTITTIAFDDFVEAMNKAASTIAKGDKGDKGDTGTVDNTGLISAPAFQSLQSQVNNLQVGGQNYLLNSATLNPNWSKNLQDKAEIFELITEAGVDNTVLHIKNSLGSAAIGLYQYPTHKFEVGEAVTQSVMARGHGQLYLSFDGMAKTFTIDSDIYTKIYLPGIVTDDTVGVFKLYVNDIGEIWCHSPKIETGSLATDWSPNPEEILTQSDYAKIKAAIVALGGSLS